jgi:hypothetical protein
VFVFGSGFVSRLQPIVRVYRNRLDLGNLLSAPAWSTRQNMFRALVFSQTAAKIIPATFTGAKRIIITVAGNNLFSSTDDREIEDSARNVGVRRLPRFSRRNPAGSSALARLSQTFIEKPMENGPGRNP